MAQGHESSVSPSRSPALCSARHTKSEFTAAAYFSWAPAPSSPSPSPLSHRLPLLPPLLLYCPLFNHMCCLPSYWWGICVCETGWPIHVSIHVQASRLCKCFWLAGNSIHFVNSILFLTGQFRSSANVEIIEALMNTECNERRWSESQGASPSVCSYPTNKITLEHVSADQHWQLWQ